MKSGLLSQRSTNTTKKMLRSHLCLLPKRIIKIFLHMEGMIASFEGVKKNVISTKYRESSSGKALLQSSGRILGSCHSLLNLGYASFLTIFTDYRQGPKMLNQANKNNNKNPPPICLRCSLYVCGKSESVTGGGSCASQCSLAAAPTAPESLWSHWSLLWCPRPEARLVESSLFLPIPGSTAAELSIS